MKQYLIRFLKAPKWIKFIIVTLVGFLAFLIIALIFNSKVHHIWLIFVAAAILSFVGIYLKKNDYEIPDE